MEIIFILKMVIFYHGVLVMDDVAYCVGTIYDGSFLPEIIITDENKANELCFYLNSRMMEESEFNSAMSTDDPMEYFAEIGAYTVISYQLYNKDSDIGNILGENYPELC